MIFKLNRKDTGNYIYIVSMIFFLAVAGGIAALIIKEFVFPDANRKEFILFTVQALCLSVTLLLASKYIKKENTKFALFFDKANGIIKSLCLLLFISTMFFIAQIIETILLIKT